LSLRGVMRQAAGAVRFLQSCAPAGFPGWRRAWLGSWGRWAVPLWFAVAALFSALALAQQLQSAFVGGSADLLGADQVLRGTRWVAEDWRAQARALGLSEQVAIEFPSMVQAPALPAAEEVPAGSVTADGVPAVDLAQVAALGPALALVRVRAVESGFPLRGQLLGRSAAATPPQAIEVQPGSIWLDAAAMARLGVLPGDEVLLGRLALRVAGWLEGEPDVGQALLRPADRALIHLSDLTATGLMGAQARISVQWYWMGSAAARAQLHAWLRPQLAPGQRLEGPEGNQAFNDTVQQATRLLRSGVISTVLLALAALGLATLALARDLRPELAVLRACGVSAGPLQRRILARWALTALLAVPLGLLTGQLVNQGVRALFAPVVALPAWEVAVAGQAALAGLLLAALPLPWLLTHWLGQTMASLWRARGALAQDSSRTGEGRPVSGANRATGPGGSRRTPLVVPLGFSLDRSRGLTLVVSLAALIAVVTLVVLLAGGVRLAAIQLGGLVVVLGLGVLLLRGLLRLLEPFTALSGMRYGWLRLCRRGFSAALEIAALVLVVTALLSLFATRSALLDSWQQRLPPEAPDTFLINIQPFEVEAVVSAVERLGFAHTPAYPMWRARLVELDGRTVDPASYPPRLQRLLTREFNLSAGTEVRADNPVVHGVWPPVAEALGDASAPAWTPVGVEQELARDLGLSLGSRLRFELDGQQRAFVVTAIRAVQWDSFAPNFFFVAAPGAINLDTAQFILSLRQRDLGEQAAQRLAELLAAHPTLTAIDTRPVLAQAARMLELAAQGIGVLVWQTLGAALVLVWAGWVLNQPQRRREARLLRELGATAAERRQMDLGEWGLLWTLVWALGVLLAWALGSALAVWWLDLPPLSPQGWALVLGTLPLLLGLAGWAWRQRPRLSLRPTGP